MMEKHFFSTAVLMILLPVFGNSVFAKDSEAKVKSKIIEALKAWKSAANLEQTKALFDDSEEIMLIGSAEAEVSKGKDQISTWLGQLYGFADFSMKMIRVGVDNYGTTVWAFMGGKMLVNFHKRGLKLHLIGFLEFWSRKKAPVDGDYLTVWCLRQNKLKDEWI